MPLPLDVLHRAPEEAARRICLSFLDEARAACDRLADDEDGEALHDFRVAIRRLRSTLRAWRKALRGALDKRDAKALRDLQRATGGGRDAEVALAWLRSELPSLHPSHRRGHRWLGDRLEQKLGASMDHVRDDVRAGFGAIESRVRERLEVMTVEVRLNGGAGGASFGDAFVANLRKHLKTLLKHLGRVESLEDEEEAHEARIRGKRLRYLVEPVAALVREGRPVVKQCKRLQDVLGDLNDTHVLLEETGTALETAASEHARRLYERMNADDEEGLQREMRSSERAGLLELARRLQKRRQDLFVDLRERWLAHGAADLRATVEALASRIEQLVTVSEEIERKYLLDGPPTLPADATVREIDQGYLPSRQMEERLRRIREGEHVLYKRTIKLGSGVRRLESEEDLDEDVFRALWPLTEGRRIRKRRHIVPVGDAVWEVDEFLDRDLWLAEIELDSEHEEVEVPDWLEAAGAREVTDRGDYANRKLAL